jgi:hypothetical protein
VVSDGKFTIISYITPTRIGEATSASRSQPNSGITMCATVIDDACSVSLITESPRNIGIMTI